jgi:hypothetical protein
MSAMAPQASLHVGKNSQLFRRLKTPLAPENAHRPREEIFCEVVCRYSQRGLEPRSGLGLGYGCEYGGFPHSKFVSFTNILPVLCGSSPGTNGKNQFLMPLGSSRQWPTSGKRNRTQLRWRLTKKNRTWRADYAKSADDPIADVGADGFDLSSLVSGVWCADCAVHRRKCPPAAARPFANLAGRVCNTYPRWLAASLPR